ncbi:class I SAM-dependent methyltransferase [Parasedimentitalea maritima]|uniref:Methyltransferase domain-containing protein n=1 Tax=Parasedimentitalea maritima TaxID=2578117 RepID=A0A6A4RCG3_9RHOB|nr:class I SAM-dependent methyltransferase [Zongyanglinia marina]KAE9625484.1 methyltransferase domain-containing protein [Zongyanglinia marina]
MANLKLQHRMSGRKWKQKATGGSWQDQPELNDYLSSSICADYETGVYGAVRVAAREGPFQNAVSIGSGLADQERKLVRLGLVQHFDLFEISDDRVADCRRLIENEGFTKNFKVHKEDALKLDKTEAYHLVFWSHSLHHMFDVNHALAWSVKALRPSGCLLVSDYIGPTRLQWGREEVRLAKQFLVNNEDVLKIAPSRVRSGSPFRRLKQYLRDPSEAPQSDRILSAYKAQTGTSMQNLGGAMIHLCGGFLGAARTEDPQIFDRLIEYDKSAREQGIAHFAFGLWCKPNET